MRDGRVLPFRLLQARLQRKSVEEALLRDVPIAYVVFDVLALGDELLHRRAARKRAASGSPSSSPPTDRLDARAV